MPDQIWYAWENGRADTHIDERWVRDGNWTPRARVHQYALDVVAEYGGLAMQIDRNFLAVGRGSVAPKGRPTCGVGVDFGDYKRLRRGATGPQVKAAQCLLRRQRRYDGRLHGRYDGRAILVKRGSVGDPVRRVQRALTAALDRRVPGTGVVDATTWRSLRADRG